MNNLFKIAQKYNLANVFKPNYLKNTIRPISRRFFSEKPLDVNTNVTKDVILYKYENTKFFKGINIFAFCQFGFWSYLSLFAFKNLRDAPVDKTEDTTWWRRINLGENKYRNAISILSFLIGWGILSITWMYSLRSVKYLILRKGGQTVTIVTYTPMGKDRMFTLGLNNLSCREMRSAVTSQLPIKVRGHYLHYILDSKGEFKNPTLFDHTAGLSRKWRS